MPQFGTDSANKLATCEKDLQTVMNEVVKIFDCKVLQGGRTPDEQFELYKQGRKQVDGKWVIVNKAEVVTYKDGYINKSNHNCSPSKAVDIIPYPVDWKDERRMIYFAGMVIATAKQLKAQGKITNDIHWGGDWNDNTKTADETFVDLPHFEIR